MTKAQEECLIQKVNEIHKTLFENGVCSQLKEIAQWKKSVNSILIKILTIALTTFLGAVTVSTIYYFYSSTLGN